MIALALRPEGDSEELQSISSCFWCFCQRPLLAAAEWWDLGCLPSVLSGSCDPEVPVITGLWGLGRLLDLRHCGTYGVKTACLLPPDCETLIACLMCSEDRGTGTVVASCRALWGCWTSVACPTCFQHCGTLDCWWPACQGCRTLIACPGCFHNCGTHLMIACHPWDIGCVPDMLPGSWDLNRRGCLLPNTGVVGPGSPA